MRSSSAPCTVSLAPMPSRRAMLRQEVQRTLMRELDLRWQQLLGSFGLSVLLLGFGVLRTGRQGLDLTAGALLVAGLAAAWWHWQRRAAWLNRLGARHDWLSGPDQVAVALGWCWAQAWPAGAGEWGAAWEGGFWCPFLAACSYALLRLRQNAMRHWPRWHFSALRQALRQERPTRR